MHPDTQRLLRSASETEDDSIPLRESDAEDVEESYSKPTRMNGRAKQSRRSWSAAISATSCCLAAFCILLLLGAAVLSTTIVRQKRAMDQQKEALSRYELQLDQLRAITHTTDSPRPGSLSTTDWKRPDGVKIIGMIFFGRPYTLDILDCYLRRNLASNGGFLDEVHFMYHPRSEEAKEWLALQMESTPEYKKIDEEGLTKICETDADGKESCEFAEYGDMWKHATEPDTIYIKIDDDVVYMHDDAIPSLVNSLILHPEAYLVFANTINSAVTQWLHWHTGAIYPYIPEPIAAKHEKVTTTTWRASELPIHPVNVDDLPEIYDVEKGDPPFEGHRWLPLEDTPLNLAKTPIAQGLYAPFGHGWRSWAIASQQHYSLFQNLEQDSMWKYLFGNGEGLWNMQYTRNSINVVAIWGRTVAEHLPYGRPDEKELAYEIPMLLNRPTLIDSKAIISHFHYATQRGGVLQTDLLDRYRAYANEKVCTQDNQKTTKWST